MLADLGVGAVEDLALRREAAVLEDEAELLADLAVAGLALLPTGASYGTDDRVDLLDDGLDDHRNVGWRVLGDLRAVWPGTPRPLP